MKNNKFFLGLILGLIISTVGVYALNINARDTAYDNTNSGSSATNMQDAIDDLYVKAGSTGKGIGEALIPAMNTYTSGDITVSAESEWIGTAMSTTKNNPAWMAFDNNDNTQWFAAYGHRSNVWLEVDFGKERSLRCVDIKKTTYGGNNPEYFVVQVSDDKTTWRNATLTQYIAVNTSLALYRVPINEEARYIRVNFSTSLMDNNGINTMQVYGY